LNAGASDGNHGLLHSGNSVALYFQPVVRSFADPPSSIRSMSFLMLKKFMISMLFKTLYGRFFLGGWYLQL